MELQDYSLKHKHNSPVESPKPSSPTDDSPIKLRVFTILVCMNALLNYDTGVIPASLIQIQAEMPINFEETAGIGSSVYIGLCTATFMVSYTFQRFSASKILLLTLVLNCVFCLLFASSYNIYLLYLSRIGMGFSQAFCVIYAPVWTNCFSPSHKSTRWMGLLQCAVPLGVVLGYAVASVFNELGLSFLDWRAAILLQAILEMPLIFSLSRIHNSYIEVRSPQQSRALNTAGLLETFGENEERNEESVEFRAGILQQYRILLNSWTFVFLTLGLSSMFFVVSGIQYWTTLYMIQALNADPVVVIIGFVVLSTTAPISGVLAGGHVSDYYGGYKGENARTAIRLCLGFAVLAFCFAVPASFVDNIAFEFVLLWLLFFFGACLVPSASGIIVDSTHPELQSAASSLSQFMFNFGGFFLAPVVSAAFMDSFDNKALALTWGFRFTLSFSIGALAFMLAAFLVIQQATSKRGNMV